MASFSDRRPDPDDEEVVAALCRQKKGKLKRKGGEMVVECFCLFHDDGNSRGAAYFPKTRTYYCFHDGANRSYDEVRAALGLGTLPPRARLPAQTSATAAGIERARELLGGKEAKADTPDNVVPMPTRYAYVNPKTKQVTAYHERREVDGRKEMPWFAPDGTLGRPDDFYPIYGATTTTGEVLLIVEGEKCVDAVQEVHDRLGEAPISAISWADGAGTAHKYADALVVHLIERHPLHVVLWPDNDGPGFQAMAKIAAVLDQRNLAYAVIDPLALELDPHGDVADYLLAGRSLSAAVSTVLATTPKAKVQDFCDRIHMTGGEKMVYPGRRELIDLKPERVRALWKGLYGETPKKETVENAVDALFRKAHENPIATAYRTIARHDSFHWRPATVGKAYRVDANGVELDDDPENTLLLLHRDTLYTGEVNLDGVREDFVAVCESFRLSPHDIAIVELWLVLALTGKQCPIMLMKGSASTGKTTLARFLVGLVDPLCAQVRSTEGALKDFREFARVLQMSNALLLDNVSTMKYEMEDTLSQIVTGLTTGLRNLYGDTVDMLRLQKAMVMTSVSVEITKSDLSTRMVVVQPSLPAPSKQTEEDVMFDLLNQLMPKVRGYIFSRCAEFYAGAGAHRTASHSFRTAGLAVAALALGYDPDELFQHQAKIKAEKLNPNDTWMDAIVDYWESECEGFDYRFVAGKELCNRLSDMVVQEGGDRDSAPKANRTFKRYVEDKEQMFKNYGFTLVYEKGEVLRGYRFTRIPT